MKTLSWQEFSEIKERFEGGTVEFIFEVPILLGHFFDPHPSVTYSASLGDEQVYMGIVTSIALSSRNFPKICVSCARELRRGRWITTKSLDCTSPISLHEATFHIKDEQEPPVLYPDGRVEYHVFFGRHCTLYPCGLPVPIHLPKPATLEEFEGAITKKGMSPREYVLQAIMRAEMAAHDN